MGQGEGVIEVQAPIQGGNKGLDDRLSAVRSSGRSNRQDQVSSVVQDHCRRHGGDGAFPALDLVGDGLPGNARDEAKIDEVIVQQKPIDHQMGPESAA